MTYWDEFCYLGVLSKREKNLRGQINPDIAWGSRTWCKPKSIRMTEAYQAQAVGMKPELQLEIRQEDYNGQTRVKYMDVRYKVFRKYFIDRSRVELTLVREVNPDEA